MARSGEPILVPAGPDGMLPRLVVPVRAGGEWLGSIWAVARTPIPPGRVARLTELASVLALHLLRLRAESEVARRVSAEHLRAALRDGAPPAVPGPPPWRVAVLGDRAIGLVPAEDRRGSSYVGVRWTTLDASANLPDVPSLAEADHRLTLAMRDATEALLTVDDFAGVPPEIADALVDLRDPGRGDHLLAPGYPQRAHRVAALAGRLSLVVDLARRMDERGLSADQMHRRGDALRLLDRAVRRALVAACNSAFDPVP